MTSTEIVVGNVIFALKDIKSARSFRRRTLLGFQWQPYILLITTAEGEREVLRHRNGYLVFQLAKAIEAAVREGAAVGDAETESTVGGTDRLTDSLAT